MLKIVSGVVLLIVIVILALPLFIHLSGGTLSNSDMASFANSAERLPLLLAPLRWAAYALVIWQWPRIVAWMAARNSEIWTTDTTRAAIAMRPRIALMAALAEVFINLPVMPAIIDWARS